MTVENPTHFSFLVYLTTANIALTLFMYFSGYGLSLKTSRDYGWLIWFKRIKKVYIPLLFTCVMAILIYAILPEFSSIEIAEQLRIPKDIALLHHLSVDNVIIIVTHALGWRDWYVFCIMIFYSIFYLSLYLTKNNPQYQTVLLWLMMVVYFVLAYLYFGPQEAHWYRYCWAFFLGHIHAKMVKNDSVNKWDLMLLGILSIQIIIESIYMIASYMTAVVILIVCSIINKKYYMNSPVLAFMGGVSFFFYLSHIRIGYTLMAYINFYSVIFWVLLTVAISFGLSKAYGIVTRTYSPEKKSL